MAAPSKSNPRHESKLKQADEDVVFMVISSAGRAVLKEFAPDHDKGMIIANRLSGNQPLREGDVEESWLRLSGQIFRFDKWSVCRG